MNINDGGEAKTEACATCGHPESAHSQSMGHCPGQQRYTFTTAAEASAELPAPIASVGGEETAQEVVSSPEDLTCEHKAFKCVISHGSNLCCYICWLEQQISKLESAPTAAEPAK